MSTQFSYSCSIFAQQDKDLAMGMAGKLNLQGHPPGRMAHNSSPKEFWGKVLMMPKRKKQKTVETPIRARGLDEGEETDGTFTTKRVLFPQAGPAQHDPATASLLDQFFTILSHLREVESGTYTQHQASESIYEVRRSASCGEGTDEQKSTEPVVELIRRKCTDLEAKRSKARADLQHEVSKRQEDIRDLDRDIAGLRAQIEEDGDVAEELGQQVVQLMVMQGQHKKAIRELTGDRELELQVEVESERRTLALTERRTLPLQDDYMYVMGGHDGKNKLASVERYHPACDKWECMPSMIHQRFGCVAAVLNRQMYVMGGRDGERRLSSVERFDPLRKKWELLEPLRTSRSTCAAAVLGGKIYVIGGRDEHELLSTVERFDAVKNVWEPVCSMHTKRYGCAAAVLNGRLYVMGGEDGVSRLSSVERYDEEKNQWELMPDMTTKRSGCAAATLNGSLYVIGGVDGSSHLSSVERYSASRNKWELVAPMLSKRSTCSAAVLQGRLYVMGGYEDAWKTHRYISNLSSVERYDPVVDKWEFVSSMDSKRSRCAVQTSQLLAEREARSAIFLRTFTMVSRGVEVFPRGNGKL
eukprot:g81890.t1